MQVMGRERGIAMTNANKCDVCGKPKCDVSRETNECDFSEDGSFCHGHAAPAATGASTCNRCGRIRCSSYGITPDRCVAKRMGVRDATCHSADDCAAWMRKQAQPAATSETAAWSAAIKARKNAKRLLKQRDELRVKLAEQEREHATYLAADVDRRWAENEDAHRLELAAVTLERDRYLETVNACWSFQKEQADEMKEKEAEIDKLRVALAAKDAEIARWKKDITAGARSFVDMRGLVEQLECITISKGFEIDDYAHEFPVYSITDDIGTPLHPRAERELTRALSSASYQVSLDPSMKEPR